MYWTVSPNLTIGSIDGSMALSIVKAFGPFVEMTLKLGDAAFQNNHPLLFYLWKNYCYTVIKTIRSASMTPSSSKKSKIQSQNSSAFKEGMQDGIPIGLGYFAVAFSLGIAAKNAGLTPFQGFLTSLLINASAGQYAGFTLIAASASYIEMIIVTLITNARYFLMSSALSQRMNPDMPFYHRFILGFDVTDEIFGITIARPNFINPYYTYGAMLVTIPFWSTGTALGIIAGNILPLRVVSALSVALYGMFLAVIIPPVHKNKVIGGLILISFAASFATSWLPVISALSSGTRTIILTIAISSIASLLFPIDKRKGAENE